MVLFFSSMDMVAFAPREPDDPEAFARGFPQSFRHPAGVKRTGAPGQERVQQHFSAERMAREILSLYQAVLEGRS